MAMPPPPVAALAGPLNPIEAIVMSLNTNTYLIGLSMILLNLGGRHLAMGLTPEQDRFFQAPWMRRSMLFVVIFVATRNVFTAMWLSLGLILFIGYLLNEHSSLYLFGEPTPLPPTPPPVPAMPGLTSEEQEIYKRLHDKVNRTKSAEELKKGGEAGPKQPFAEQLEGWYKQNMAAMRSLIAA
jgi:hypothetical protein